MVVLTQNTSCDGEIPAENKYFMQYEITNGTYLTA